MNNLNEKEKEHKCACGHKHEESHVHTHGEACGCGDDCTCEHDYNPKDILIEYLFLELDSEKSNKIKDNLFEAVDELKKPLEIAGYSFSVKGYKIDSIELAKEFEVDKLPAICVNFADILKGIDEVPTKGMIIESTLKEIFNPSILPEDSEYEVPENIKKDIENS